LKNTGKDQMLIYNDKSEKELNKKLLNFNNYFCIYQGSFLKERIEDNEEIYIILHESALEAIEYKYGEVWYTKKELNNVKNTNFIYEFIEVEDIIE
jgi:hypothetical protein